MIESSLHAVGSGIHIAQFAAAFPGLNFQPTECDEYGLQEIDKTVERLKNVKKAILLDVTDKDRWNELEKEGPFDTVLGSNFLHMIPLYVLLQLKSPRYLISPPVRKEATQFSVI